MIFGLYVLLTFMKDGVEKYWKNGAIAMLLAVKKKLFSVKLSQKYLYDFKEDINMKPCT